MRKKIVLIDGHSILNRAFFGIPDLTNSEGLHTNAIYGFLNILFKILEEEHPDYLTVAFDVHAPTFRHKMYGEYKGTRKPMAEELRQQVPVMKDVLRAMDIPVIEQEGYEADDILGTIAGRCERQGLEVRVISGDRDLLQLATEHTMIRIPKTKRTGTEIENYFAADVLEKYKVTPAEFIDVKALMGDSSDNIPGVPGVGEKTATNLIVAYKSIENAYLHLDEIKPPRAQKALREHYDMAQMSKILATIDVNARIDFDLESAALGDLYTEEAYLLMKRLELKKILERFEVDVPENGAEQFFRIVGKAGEAQQAFEILKNGLSRSDNKKLALALITEKGKLYGITMVAGAETTVCFLLGDDLVPEKILQFAEKLLKEADLLISPDLKLILKYMDIPEEYNCFDTTIGAYLLNPLKNEYPYDDLAKDYLGMLVPSRMDLLGKTAFAKLNESQKEAFGQMACYTGYVAWSCQNVLEEKLKKEQMLKLFKEVEMPLVFTLADMEQQGVRVDADALAAYGKELSFRIEQLEQSIYTQAGEKFNLNSPKQLGVILFEKLQMPNAKKTKTGYSTAADVLEKLAPDYPIVSDILEYRQLAKLKSTYADGLAAFISEDGRIHGTFNQTITATGRLSSTDPNLQNIPVRMELGKMIRKVFLPEDGYVFMDADYSQIELRVLAHMSGDRNLIDAYRHAEDIHRITASQVFHIPLDQVTDLQRRSAKAVNFGIVYGISSFGLSQDLSISRKEAQQYIERYFETFPGIKKFLDSLIQSAKENGYAVTLFGRRRPVPELKSSNYMQRSFGERIAMNSPIQGTAADIIKIAMNRVRARLKKEGMKSRLILQVHDELLVETAEDEKNEVRRILDEEMRSAAHLEVTLETDTKEGCNWYEVH